MATSLWARLSTGRIKWRLTIAYVVITYVAMSSAGLLISYLIERELSAGSLRILNSHAKLVKSVVEEEYRAGRAPDDPDRLCRDLASKINARVRIVGLDHYVIGDSSRRGTDNPLEDPAERLKGLGCRVCHPEARSSQTLLVREPIAVSGRTIGEAQVSSSLFGAKQASARTRRIILSALVVAALFAAGLSQRLAASIARPITDMSAVAKAMAEGDLSQRVSIESSDEIGQLAASFNTMALQLQKMVGEMAEDKDKMETILTTMADGIVVTDESGIIVLFNKSSEGIFGLRASDTVGRHVDDLDLHPELARMVRETLKSQRLVRKELKLAGETEITLSAYSSPVKDHASNVKGAVVVLHDLTEIKRHERVQKEFVANVSHELRTPITAVRVTAEALLSGAKDNPKLLGRFLDTLVKESERLSLLIDDLLEIARRDAGRREVRKGEVAIYDVAERVLNLYKSRAQRNKTELTLDMPDLEVLADERQVEQVLTNLVDNAIKYTPQGGKVAITAGEDEGSVWISVSDTGIGIPQAEVPRIFERFYRVDKARSRQLGGTGLGLSIVKEIVDAHGGTITVQTKLGEGSTFTVAIPKHSYAGSVMGDA